MLKVQLWRWRRQTVRTKNLNYTVHNKVHTYTVHFPLCPNDNEQVYDVDVYNIIEKQCKNIQIN